MKKLVKNKIVLYSLTVIALCVSLITGATFAYFTDTSNVDIIVKSGKVNVTAEVTALSLYSPKKLAADGSVADADNIAQGSTFGNGGTARVRDGKLEISGITAGDRVELEITVTDNGDVATAYRYGYRLLDGEGNAYDAAAFVLFEGLNFTFDGASAKTTDSLGSKLTVAYKTAYAPLPQTKTIPVVVELPGNAGNQYQGLSLTIGFIVEAVQANVVTPEGEEKTVVTVANENLSAQLGEAGSTVTIVESGTIGSGTTIAEGVTVAGLGKEQTTVIADRMNVEKNNVTIKDMTIKGQTPAGHEGSLKVGGKNTTVENVKLVGSGFNGDTKGISVTGESFVLRDSHISNAFRGIIFWDNIGGNNLIDNCVIENVVYTFNINASTVKPGTTLTVKDSTLNGWTSYAGCMSHVTFEECNLGRSRGYAYLVAYADSTFIGCTFNDGYQVAAGSTGKTLTFTNCKLGDGTVITAENFAEKLGDVDDDLKSYTVIVNGVTVNWN